MYKEIDELVDAICQDKLFQNYVYSEKAIHEEKIMLLLSRHQMLQDDYLRMKRYQSYITTDNLKQQLKEVKQAMLDQPQIQAYYHDYYAFNDLLEEVTKIVFKGISEELSLDMFTM